MIGRFRLADTDVHNSEDVDANQLQATVACQIQGEREGKRNREGAGVKQVLFSHLLAGCCLELIKYCAVNH